MADKKKPSDKETTKSASKAKADSSAKTAATASASPSTKKAKSDKPAFKRAPLLVQTRLAEHGKHNTGWKLVDATGLPLGRLSSEVAMILMGKRKPIYTPSVDTGDHVIVVNAEKVKLTGKKLDQKLYQKHSNYPGGLKTHTARDVMEDHPERLVQLAVWRMLPKSKGHLTRHWFKKLRVYKGTEHPHKAQEPETVKLTNIGTWEN